VASLFIEPRRAVGSHARGTRSMVITMVVVNMVDVMVMMLAMLVVMPFVTQRVPHPFNDLCDPFAMGPRACFGISNAARFADQDSAKSSDATEESRVFASDEAEDRVREGVAGHAFHRVEQGARVRRNVPDSRARQHYPIVAARIIRRWELSMTPVAVCLMRRASSEIDFGEAHLLCALRRNFGECDGWRLCAVIQHEQLRHDEKSPTFTRTFFIFLT